MAGLGWQELVIVLVIIMIIFGAGKLPEIAKSLGQGREGVPRGSAGAGGAGNHQHHGDRDRDDPALGRRWLRVMTAEETVDETGETVRVEEVRTAPTSRDAI